MKIKNMLAAGCASLALMMAASPATVLAHYDQEAADAAEAEEPAVEVVEETEDEADSFVTEETDPLTPDGNMTLVDDIGSADKSGKQFITMVTKNGNYFYIVIDRDDDGEENVHFLNQVDEADLLALMEEEDVEAYESRLLAEAQKKEAAEKAAREAEEAANQPAVEEPVEEKSSFNPLPAVILGLGLLAGGGFYAYTTFGKKKKEEDERPDPDADYEDDDMNSQSDDDYFDPEEFEEDEFEEDEFDTETEDSDE